MEYGTPLSNKQLNARASVPGTFAYNPTFGTTPPVGTDTLSVTFTPSDSAKYASSTMTVPLLVKEKTPMRVPNKAVTDKGKSRIKPGRSRSTQAPPAKNEAAQNPADHASNNIPEITAKFIAGGKSPGLILWNDSKVVIRDPRCSLMMWDLDRSSEPHTSLPGITVTLNGNFIKPNSGILEATLDRPDIVPLIKAGDRIFGLAVVDCSDCKETRRYLLYIVYGGISWYSPVPDSYPINSIRVAELLVQSGWNPDTFMTIVPHGEIIAPLRQ